jgi:molybdenum storage protein
VGRIPPHRTDAGCFLLAECFGCKSLVLVKDVDGVYDKDPKADAGAKFFAAVSATELERRAVPSLPFDRVLLRLLRTARLLKQFQIVNGHKPELIEAAINGKHVGTIVFAR